MKVSAATKEDCRWLFARISWVPTLGFKAIVAHDSSGAIRGMVGYDCWTPNSVQMHVALASGAAARSLLGPAFQYPFEQLAVGVVLGVVPANNAPSLNFARKVGMRETHRIADGWAPGVDLLHFEMRREECRFLSSKAKAA
jgi:hypothetical protein